MIARDLLPVMVTMPAGAERSGAGQRAPLRIIVVEDEALVALEIESFLGAAGHAVVGVVEDRVSAAELAQQVGPRPDLALVDVRLAGGASGLQVAADLAALDIPVLFVTGNCPASYDQRIAVGCLQKPFTEGELLASVAATAAILTGQALPRRLPSGLHLYGAG